VKRLRETVLLGCLAVLLLPAAVAAMDADELIAKHMEASGGVAQLKAVQTQKITGKVMAQGMEIPFTMVHKRPNMMRLDAQVMGMTLVQCFDGEKGWAINPMTGSEDPQPMGEVEEKSFRLQADMDGLLVDYADKGYTVEYLGEDEVEGTPVHKLRLDTGDDVVLEYAMDTEYFLIIKQDSKLTYEGNVIESSTYMSDYQEVDGMVTPFSIETRRGDAVMNQIMVETIDYAADVDPSVFVMPEKAEPEQPAPAEEGK
jgi:outer membrane lipoprotein-sorting protein